MICKKHILIIIIGELQNMSKRIFQSVRPMLVKTEMSKLSHRWEFLPEPDTYVKQSLATIGKQRKTHGSLLHTFQVSLPNFEKGLTLYTLLALSLSQHNCILNV